MNPSKQNKKSLGSFRSAIKLTRRIVNELLKAGVKFHVEKNIGLIRTKDKDCLCPILALGRLRGVLEDEGNGGYQIVAAKLGIKNCRFVDIIADAADISYFTEMCISKRLHQIVRPELLRLTHESQRTNSTR